MHQTYGSLGRLSQNSQGQSVWCKWVKWGIHSSLTGKAIDLDCVYWSVDVGSSPTWGEHTLFKFLENFLEILIFFFIFFSKK